MTHSSHMLETARQGAAFLGGISDDVAAFVRGRMNADGGFAGRDGASDLYYTAFALDSLIACGASVPWSEVGKHLHRFGAGEDQDFVHMTCLARCWSRSPNGSRAAVERNGLLDRIEQHRCPDGGYHTVSGSATGSITGMFLAMTTLQEFGRGYHDEERIADSIQGLRTRDGAYANERGLESGTTLATAGAMILLTWLGRSCPGALEDWLLTQRHPMGGFRSSPAAPVSDLLSTATALYALKVRGADMSRWRAQTVDFVDGLWHESGGYCGYWTDDTPDCEYSYYALLAIGCVAPD